MKRKEEYQAMCRTQSRENVQSGVLRLRQLAQKDKTVKFTALLHHVTPERLKESFYSLKRKATPGIDGITWAVYERDLEANVKELHSRIHKGSYCARPTLEKSISKPDGGSRKIGLNCVEDKIVQHAVMEVLSAIYESDFLGFSYGFRAGRSCHDALDALAVGISRKKVNWVLDVDIQGFYDTLSHQWIRRFLQHRIADKRVLRIIDKWLEAGVTRQGKWESLEQGVGQGSVISPLLSNIYLHYVFDLWVQQYRKKRAKGDVIVVRYGDDIALGFEHKGEAEAFLEKLKQRFAQFQLQLHPKKTKLVRFGRFADEQCKKLGIRKPGTFEFLGFTHICTRTYPNRHFAVKRITAKKRMCRALKAIKETLMQRRHEPIPVIGEWIKSSVQGYFNYHAVPGNIDLLSNFRREVSRYWLKALRRRSQRHNMNWEKYGKLSDLYIPTPKRLHDYPYKRFDAKYAS